MDDKLLQACAGFVIPVLIDVINKKISNSNVRYFVSMGVCLLLGVIFNINKLSWNDVLTSGAIVFAAAQTSYKTYWKTSDIREVILR